MISIPKTLEYLFALVKIYSDTLSHIINEIALILGTIFEGILSSSMSQTIDKIPCKFIPIMKHNLTLSCYGSILKLSFINVAICKQLNPLTIFLTLSPSTFISISIRSDLLTLALSKPIYKLTNVLIPFETHFYTLSMELSILHLTFKKVSIFFNQSSHWTRNPFSPITLKVVSIREKTLAFSISYSIFVPLTFVDGSIKQLYRIFANKLVLIGRLNEPFKKPKSLSVINDIF